MYKRTVGFDGPWRPKGVNIAHNVISSWDKQKCIFKTKGLKFRREAEMYARKGFAFNFQNSNLGKICKLK
jgi:hypothetical protein